MCGQFGWENLFRTSTFCSTTSPRSRCYRPLRIMTGKDMSFSDNASPKGGRSWTDLSFHRILRQVATLKQKWSIYNSYYPKPSALDGTSADNLLISVIVDASVRRFEAQRIFLRATIAARWIYSRNTILFQEFRPTAAHQSWLTAVEQNLQNVRNTDKSHAGWKPSDSFR